MRNGNRLQRLAERLGIDDEPKPIPVFVRPGESVEDAAKRVRQDRDIAANQPLRFITFVRASTAENSPQPPSEIPPDSP